MTYEEKLDLILKALFEAKKATIEGKTIQLYVKNGNNGLDIFPRAEIYSILEKLQKEEKILRVWWETNRILRLNYQAYVNADFILVRCNDTFDNWYKQYLLKQKTKSNNNKATDDKITYDPKTRCLSIRGKSVKFREDSLRANLLKILLKDDESCKKEWSWDVLFKKIEGLDPNDNGVTKINKNKYMYKIYDGLKSLNERILREIGIREFVLFTTKTARVNPKYLE